MKKILSIILLFVSVGSINAQLFKLGDVQSLKKAKLIIGLSGNDKQDEALKNAVKNFWTFSEVQVEALPKVEAMFNAKADPNLFVVSVGSTKGRSLTHQGNGYNYRYIARGVHLEMNSGKHKAKPEIKQYIPTFGEEKVITEEIFASALSSIQYLCNTMVKKGMKSNMKFKSAYKPNSPKLKKKVLYIAEGWIDPKIEGNVSNLYNGKVVVVSYEKWREVILSKKEGAAYSIVIPVLVGADYVYQHYLMDAQTGLVYGIAYPKAPVKMNFAPGVKVNLSKANNGYVNEKILKKYNGVLEGKW